MDLLTSSNQVTTEPRPAHADESDRRQLTPSRIATAARVMFILVATLAVAWLARPVLIPIILAVFGAITLKKPVRWLCRSHMPRPVAAAIVVGLLVTGFGYGMIYLGRPALDWLNNAPDNIPRLKEKFQNILRPAARLSEAASSVGNLAKDEVAEISQKVEVKDNHVASTLFTWTGSILAGVGETIALLFLLLAAGDVFLLKLVQASPRLRDKKRAVEISRDIQQSVSGYLFSVTLINIGFGGAVALALHLLGMPGALMWGGVAAFANFIPFLGPILGMGAVAIAGLMAFDTLGRGLMPAGAYFILHLIESNAVTPFVLGRRFALNPVIIFVVLIFFAWIWGIIGALLAVPILVTLKIIADRTPELHFIGEMLSPQLTSEALLDNRGAPHTPHAAGDYPQAQARPENL